MQAGGTGFAARAGTSVDAEAIEIGFTMLCSAPTKGFLARTPEEVAELEEVQTMFLCKMRHQPSACASVT
jgi:hypothetical protein